MMNVPPIDPAREAALMAAFDAHWARGGQPSPHGVWRAAAALIAITLVINWLVVSNPRRIDGGAGEVVESSEFVSWPGAEGWPPFESGSVVQVELPVSALHTLGLAAPASGMRVVQAEIVVGQDGFARAVRVLQ